MGGSPVVVADVCDSEAMAAAVPLVAEQLGGLTIMVNNAGVGNVKPMIAIPTASTTGSSTFPCGATFIGIRAAAPVMLEGGRGSIVNMASISGMRPTRGEAPYAASKAAVIALTQSAALEYLSTLRVNCVSPGLIETSLTAPLMGDEKVRAGFDRKTPLGRWDGRGRGLGDCLSRRDMAAYVTGINIPVDGGSLLPSAQVDGVLFGPPCAARLIRRQPVGARGAGGYGTRWISIW